VSAVPSDLRLAARPIRGTRSLPVAWPLYAALIAYPLWWALGVGYFIWPLLTFPLLIALLASKRIAVPPGFGIWLLFLAWMLLSGTQLTEMSFAFAWRAFTYLSATVLFLYLFNARRTWIPDRTVIVVLAVFWAEVIAAGLLGVAFPTVTLDTPAAHLMPGALRADELVQATVRPGLSDVMMVLGYPVGRPKALFAYTNQWGACAALLAPFAIAAFAYLGRPAHRRALAVCVGLSLVPLVFSLNRGVWITLGIAFAYTALRIARPGNRRALAAGGAAVLVATAIVFATPLGTLAQDRVNTESASTDTRLGLYHATVQQVRQSPLLGVGSPSTRTEEGSAPPVGTQGQLPLLAYSHGIPGLVLFVGWFLYTAVRSARFVSPGRFAAHLTVVIGILLLPYYSLLPVALHVLMVAAALAWRDVPSRTPARPRVKEVPA
jgi:polysaccharide biosynthesis protein PslJ